MRSAINPPNTPLTDGRGIVSPPWYRYFVAHKAQADAASAISVITATNEVANFPNSRKLTFTAPILLVDGGPGSTLDIRFGGTTDDIAEGSINLYYTDARSRASITAGPSLIYDAVTGVMDMPDVIVGGVYGSASEVLEIEVDDQGRIISVTEHAVALPAAGSTEIDFGATPTDSATLTLAVPGVTSSTVVQAWISAGDTSADNDIGQHAIASASVKILTVPSTNQIDFEAHNLFGLATGKFKLRYQYS